MVQESVRSRRGMVAASHRYAAEAGRDVLAEGGNALEAALAAGAAIVVAYPHMNHLGGDGFWLFREPSGPRPLHRGLRLCRGARHAGALPGGRATRRSRRAARSPRSRCRGWSAAGCFSTRPPALGRPDAAVAAPGARHRARPQGLPGLPLACLALHHRSRRRRSTRPASPRPFSSTASRRRRARRCRRPARRHARAARPRRSRRFLSRRHRPRDRRRPRADRQPGHARGPGALPRALARAASMPAQASGTLYNSPPPTQGLASLLILGIYERLGDAAAGELRSSARHHRGDQARLPHPRPGGDRLRPAQTVDPAPSRPRGAGARGEGDRPRSAPRPGRSRPGKGDTVWLGAADASGLVVSYIQSLFWEFGSGCVLPQDRHRHAEPRASASRSIRRR